MLIFHAIKTEQTINKIYIFCLGNCEEVIKLHKHRFWIFNALQTDLWEKDQKIF